ncbi:DUF4232 domain-containing protein [Streptomyces sp. NPDC046716]|uniref:DUF4232 domain-containing protein n=1 Tax=Streptomyces sp. NPDC046716 TaxID=3157093 RepID=UPI0033F374F3
MRAQKFTLAAVALTAGLALTACQDDGDAASASNDSAAASSSSSSSSSSASSSTGSSGSSDSASTGGSTSSKGSGSSADDDAPGSGGGQINTGPCKTANLSFSTAHGMGEGDFMVALKNTSDACSLKGFPGVDLQADNGGGSISAGRTGVAPVSVVLKNGEETRFHLHYTPNTSGGSGVTITSLLVTPPNETHSKKVPVSLNLPVSDKPSGGVTVDPIGTGKQ